MNTASIQLVSIGQVRPNPVWGMPPHRHSLHEMIAVARGRMTVTTRQGVVTARAGDVLFYGAGVVHEEHSDPADPVQTYFISFHWDDYTPDVPFRVHDRHGRVSVIVRWLFEDRHNSTPMIGAVRQGLAQSAVASYLHLAAYQEPDLVERTRHFVRARLAAPLEVDDLAAEAQMSKFHFVRTYKQLCGRTPMDDVRRLRVEAARDLLLTTDLPLKSIAPRVGMANANHLSRLVRRYLHMTANDVRKKVLWDEPPVIEDHG